MSYLSVAPFGQSVPRLMGLSGSPSTCTTVGITFFALSPSVWTITPHATAQYGQMLRVSVVRAILNCRISARARDTSNPIPAAAPATAAPFKNVRRFIEPPRRSGRTGQDVPFTVCADSGMHLKRRIPSRDAPRRLHSSVTSLSRRDQLERSNQPANGARNPGGLARRLQPAASLNNSCEEESHAFHLQVRPSRLGELRNRDR